MLNPNLGIKRRNLLGMAAGAAALGGLAAGQSPRPGGVNRNSAPSQLRITDMRAIRIASNYDYPIIRIDTNQGVYGLGEVRDAGNEGMALVLKPHIMGKNPLNIEPILDSVRNFTNQRRFGGGYSALDIALHDIAGKVYGVPAWRLIGSQYRNRVRVYCDTTESSEPKIYAERMTARKKAGFTFFKMDVMPSMIRHRPGALNSRGVATAKGLEMYGEHIQAVRDAIGWDVPLAADHFGPLDVNDSIRHARYFEKFELAWAEDLLQVGTLGSGDAPRNWRAYKEIKDSTVTPINTGESLFGLEEGFRPLIENNAVDLIHPDPLTSGAIREDQADFGLRLDVRDSDRRPLRRLSGGLHGRGAHDFHPQGFRGDGKPRRRYSLVGRPGDRAGQAHHPERLYHGAGDSGNRSGTQRGSLQGASPGPPGTSSPLRSSTSTLSMSSAPAARIRTTTRTAS